MTRLTYRSLGSFLTLVLLVGATLIAPVSPVAAASCSVENARTGTTYETLQAAVDASSDGDTLFVSGTCVGKTWIRRADLIIRGTSDVGQPPATMDGGGRSRVLNVRSSTVVIRDVTLTNGEGGGIALDKGRVVLTGETSVAGNDGGGIFAGQWSTLVLKGTTGVSGNVEGDSGGGIASKGRVIMKGAATVEGNSAGWGGGIFLFFGRLTMGGTASVTGNAAVVGDSGGGVGGGIMADLSRVTLRGSASVTGNTAEAFGGGIYDGIINVCSDDVAISPNDPDDPPKVRHVCP